MKPETVVSPGPIPTPVAAPRMVWAPTAVGGWVHVCTVHTVTQPWEVGRSLYGPCLAYPTDDSSCRTMPQTPSLPVPVSLHHHMHRHGDRHPHHTSGR